MPTLDALEAQLAGSDPEERRVAAVALGQLGAEALPLLFRALGDTDWRVRKTAVEALAATGGTGVITGLIQLLHAHDNAGARNSAIEALVQIGGQAVEELFPVLEHRDPDVRKFVVDILGDIKDPRAVPALINALKDDDENIRVAAAEALGKIRDPRAVDALLTCLTRSDLGWLDYAAAEALGEIGDTRALAPLLAALSRSSLREPVLESLGKIGNADTVEPLIAGLADPLRIVREVSIVAISAIYRKSAQPQRARLIETVRALLNDRAVAFLEEILVESSGDLHRATVALLAWSGREQSIRKLLVLLKEEDLADTVVQSLDALDREQASFLVDFLASDNALIRRAVAQVLGDLGAHFAEPRLIELLSDENGHVRSTAAESLGRLRSRNAVQPLRALLTDEYVSVQESAIYALAAVGDETVLEDLFRDFSSHDPFLRRNIVILLGKFSSDRVADALAFALKDEEPSVRKAVVQALGHVRGETALRSLLLAITDDDAEVRMLAAEALGDSHAPAAAAALTPLLEDEDLWVRAAAARGLGKTGGEQAGAVLTAHLTTATDIFLLAIIEVLGSMNYVPGLDQLVPLAEHADPEVRKAVLASLAGYGGETVQQAAVSRLADPHWSVRKAAIEVLRRHPAPAAKDQLTRLADSDPDITVRQAAREALVK